MNLSGTIQQIDSLKKEADALQPVKPEFEQKFWDKYRLEFNYNSNHIEGNTLTYGHTQLLLLFDKVGGDYTLRELEEMKAHDVALRLVKEAALDPEHHLSEKFIKEINQTILVRPYYKEAITEDGQPTRRLIEPGQYKKYPNSVRLENGEIFHYASPEETSAQMGDLMEWIRKEEESKELHPVQLAALVHYRFVRIHPFDDSNGRTSRLLMNYILIKYGYAPLVVESIDKKNYLFALNSADVGDIDVFIDYISLLSLRWQELLNKALLGISIQEPEDFEKEVAILKKEFPENEKREKFSPQKISYLFSNSFYQLFKEFLTKIEKLDEFFNEKRVLFGMNRGSRLIKKHEQIERLFSDQYLMEIQVGVFFELDYEHIEFLKTTTHGINFVNQLRIHLNQYTYSISINKQINFIEKSYADNLTINEINSIITEVANNELAFIKRQLK